MYFKITLNLFFILILSIFQISIISALPAPFNYLNLIIVAIIFILGILGLDYALWWALGAGLMMDLFSFNFFGSHMLSLFLAIFVANFLLKNFLTDKSLYVFLISIAVVTVIYELFFNLFIFLFSFFVGEEIQFFSVVSFLRAEASQLFLNAFFVLLIFYFLSIVSDRLRPVFLIKNKK